MHIKEVKIKNFMSIKDEIWTDLHTELNLIVGTNGSGKSTFLRAIRFIFTNHFPCSTQQEKQIILNQNNFARVDITISDLDNRLLLDQEITSFSRQLEAKKDSYFVNNKLIKKANFFNLLESAEIPIRNPFYVVPQGEATKIPKLTNKARLDILEEFCGAKYLKEKQLISQQYNEDFDKKIQFLDEIQENFEDNLQFLEENVKEVHEYKRLTKQVDSISRIILNGKIEKTVNNLDNLKKKDLDLQTKKMEYDNYLEEIHNKLEDYISLKESIENEIEILKQKEKNLSTKKIYNKKGKRQIELTKKDLGKELVKLEEIEEKIKNNLENKIRNVTEFEERLLTDIPQFEEKSSELTNLNHELALKENQVSEIYARKGRARQFKSKSERDSWIENKLFVLEEQKIESESELNNINQQIEIEEKTKSNFQEKIKTLENHIQLQKTKMMFNFETVGGLISEMSENSKKLAELRDQLNEKEKILSDKKSELAEIEQKFSKLVPKTIYDAMKSVKRVLEVFRDQDESVKGYHNLLIDIFQVNNENLKPVIENAAGNRLFHHVVDTDSLSTKIIDGMNLMDFPGEANFLPLNRLHFLERDAQLYDCAVNLLNLLTYEPQFDPAIRCVFGNKWICKDFLSAVRISREYNVDCYTIDGETAFPNGLLSGGSTDNSSSRIEIYEKRKQLEETVNILQEEVDGIEKQINEIKHNKLATENKINSPKINRGEVMLARMKMDLENEMVELKLREGRISEERKLKTVLESKLENIQREMRNFRNSLNEELDSQLNEEEEDLLKCLRSEIIQLRNQRETSRKIVEELQEEKEKLENLLNNRLKIEIAEMKNKIESTVAKKEKLKLEIGDLKLSLIEFQNDALLEENNENIITDFNESKKKLKEIENEIKKMEPTREELEGILKNLNNEIEDINSKIRGSLSKKAKYEEEIGGLSATKLRDPNLENQSTEVLQNRLDKSRKELRKMKLNPMAEELYKEVNNFKEEFLSEIEKLKLSRNSRECETKNAILGNEVLEEEFEHFRENFDKYFKKFVPNGKGELIHETMSSDPEMTLAYSGIDIHVTFSGREKKNLKSLSGGEKSIVSVAFILAAARNNVPPFFIFDEIDAALSVSNAAILARIIKQLSQRVQIFMTTFNEQTMLEGNHLFKVTIMNNISKISRVPSQEDQIED